MASRVISVVMAAMIAPPAVDIKARHRGQSVMFLIRQYDSPFVRRVAIAMRLYGIAYEHKPWSTFGEGDKIAPYNPLRRVPTLVLDDGESLLDSAAILDYLDELAGPAKALMP